MKKSMLKTIFVDSIALETLYDNNANHYPWKSLEFSFVARGNFAHRVVVNLPPEEKANDILAGEISPESLREFDAEKEFEEWWAEYFPDVPIFFAYQESKDAFVAGRASMANEVEELKNVDLHYAHERIKDLDRYIAEMREALDWATNEDATAFYGREDTAKAIAIRERFSLGEAKDEK